MQPPKIPGPGDDPNLGQAWEECVVSSYVESRFEWIATIPGSHNLVARLSSYVWETMPEIFAVIEVLPNDYSCVDTPVWSPSTAYMGVMK